MLTPTTNFNLRPHPNECSGSDLDGNIYFVCWDIELIPPKQVKPLDYTPPKPIELDHDVMIEEVQEYFTDYILNDSVGIIANAHIVAADKESRKAMAQKCIDLAKLFSTAVDFPKTGIPAVMPPALYVKEYPDFMEKQDKNTYVSHNVIGKLFREVVEVSTSAGVIKPFTLEVATESYDSDIEVDGFKDYVDDAFHCKRKYDYKLGNLMDYYGIKTEAEILSGNILKKSKNSKDVDAINRAVTSLRKEARNWFNNNSNSDDNSGSSSSGVVAWGRYKEGMELVPCYIPSKLLGSLQRRYGKGPFFKLSMVHLPWACSNQGESHEELTSSSEHSFSHGLRID